MTTAIATNDKGSIMESVLIKGDLAKLTAEERSTYYMKVCDSIGINPLTKPFDYIVLNGKMTLYALRTATDQIRAIHKVSVEELTETEREGVFIVTAKVKNGEGRTDIAKGAVNIKGLQGEALANALMKAETKAKRRATLSICGLGMLDESELETIPPESFGAITPSDIDHTKPKSPFKNASLRNAFQKNTVDSFHAAKTTAELESLRQLSKVKFDEMQASGDERDSLSLDEMRKQFKIAWNRLVIAEREQPAEDDDESEAMREYEQDQAATLAAKNGYDDLPDYLRQGE